MGRRLGTALGLALLLVLGAQARAGEFMGRVVSVVDGDTIGVLHNGQIERVRLEGIDCPESNQTYGPEATQATTLYCLNNDVTVQVTGQDRYGRTLGVVLLPDGSSLNAHLLSDGMAWHFKKYNSDPALASLETKARNAHTGLWSEPNPQPPWEFSHGGAKIAGLAQQTSNPAPSSSSAPDPGDQTVYITRTGAKYHRSGCSSLRKSSIPIKLKDAVTKGYTPCSRCNPPTMGTQGTASSSAEPAPSQTQQAGVSGTPTGQTTATGIPIYKGPRGGRYHYSKSGKKVYERKKK
jgi:endonuclease YncB( thermonuclease family)